MTHQHQSDDQQTPAADEAPAAAALPPEARPLPEILPDASAHGSDESAEDLSLIHISEPTRRS